MVKGLMKQSDLSRSTRGNTTVTSREQMTSKKPPDGMSGSERRRSSP